MKRINLLDGLMQVTLTLFFAELVFPPLTTVGNSSVICLLCFISWFCLSIVKNRFFYLKCPFESIDIPKNQEETQAKRSPRKRTP